MTPSDVDNFLYADRRKTTRQIGRKQSPDEVLTPIFGEPFKEYRRKWYAADTLDYVPPYPLELGFDIQFACNLRCVGCYFGDDTPRSPYMDDRSAFPIEKFRAIVEHGVENGLASTYFGYATEPTINKRYLDYVDIARSAGVMDVWFGTNGTLLTEESIDHLIEMQVSRVLISVDAATKETFGKVRIRGDYDRVVENINYLVRRKQELGSVLPLLRLSFFVNSINQHEEQLFIDQWGDKADYFSIQNFCALGEEASEHLWPEGTRPKEPNPNFSCPQPFQRLFLNANGDVYPCCSFDNMYNKELRLGDAFAESIESIWHGESLVALRESHRNKTYGCYKNCMNCAYSSEA